MERVNQQRCDWVVDSAQFGDKAAVIRDRVSNALRAPWFVRDFNPVPSYQLDRRGLLTILRRARAERYSPSE